MTSIYDKIPANLIIGNGDDLVNQIFKLLPYKESNSECLESHFDNIIFRLVGLSRIIESPEVITVISWLEAAKTESDFKMYRKAILDSCSAIKNLQTKLGEGHA